MSGVVVVVVEGNVSLIFDYVWCGSLQSDGDLVVQVGVKLISLCGWYVLVWGLGVLFQFDNGVCSEFDLVVGWSGVVVDDWVVDVNLICYLYLLVNVDLDWIEFNGMLIWQQCYWLQVGVLDNVLVGGYGGMYVQFGVCLLLGEVWWFEGVIGYYWFDSVQSDDYLYGQFSVVWCVYGLWELCLIVYDIDCVV